MKRSLLAQGLLDCSLNMDLLLILALIKARVLHLTLIESNSGILLLFSISIVNILESISRTETRKRGGISCTVRNAT